MESAAVADGLVAARALQIYVCAGNACAVVLTQGDPASGVIVGVVDPWGVLRSFGLKMGQVAKGCFEQRVLELAEGNPMLEAAANPILSARRALCAGAGRDGEVAA